MVLNANLFDVISENFFNLLSGKNKRFYADCLITLHREYQTMIPEDFTRTFLLDVVKETLSKHNDSFDIEDVEEKRLLENEYSLVKTNVKENLAIARMRKCGWIEISEPDDKNIQLVSFTNAAWMLLPKISEIASPNKVSLGGYTRNIVSNLKFLKTAKRPYTDAFIHALKLTEDFMKDMDRIRLEIKNDIKNILNCEDYVLSAKMLGDYLEKSLNGDYYRIQFEEALSERTSMEIADYIMDTRDDDELMEKLIEGAMDYHSMTREDAENHIETRLDMIYEHLCRRYNERYDRILTEQRKYISNASAKINAFMVDRKNIRGLVKNLLIELNKEPCPGDWIADTDVAWIDTLRQKLTVPGAICLGDRSLYQTRKAGVIDVSGYDSIPEYEPSEEAFKQSMQSSQIIYSKKRVEKIIEKRMAGKDAISADEFPLKTKKHLVEMIASAIVTKDEGDKYEIEFLPSSIRKNGFEAPDFVIRKKQK